MSEAFEVSPDDTAGVAKAIRHAAAGSTVRLVLDGQPVAEIVPPTRIHDESADHAVPRRDVVRLDDAELDAEGLAALEARMAALPPDAGRAGWVHAERFGAPTLTHYRRVWTQTGAPWPGEAFVRRHYPVADAS